MSDYRIGNHQVQDGIDHIISEIHRIRLNIPGQDQGQDQNFILRRFLEDAETYAESVYEASTAIADTVDEYTEAGHSTYQRSPERNGYIQRRISFEDRPQRPLEDRSLQTRRTMQDNQNQDGRRITALRGRNQRVETSHERVHQSTIPQQDHWDGMFEDFEKPSRSRDVSSAALDAAVAAKARALESNEAPVSKYRTDHQTPTRAQRPVQIEASYRDSKFLTTTTVASNEIRHSYSQIQQQANRNGIFSDPGPRSNIEPRRDDMPASQDPKPEVSPINGNPVLGTNPSMGNAREKSSQEEHLATDLLNDWKSRGQGRILYSQRDFAGWMIQYSKISFDGKYLVTIHGPNKPLVSNISSLRVLNLFTGVEKTCNRTPRKDGADYSVMDKILNLGISKTHLYLAVGDGPVKGICQKGYVIQQGLDDLPPDQPSTVIHISGNFNCMATAFSADGKLFARGASQRPKLRLRAYDVANGGLLMDTTVGLSKSVAPSEWQLRFNRENTVIMAYSNKLVILIFEVKTGIQLSWPKVQFNTRSFATFSADLTKAARSLNGIVIIENFKKTGPCEQDKYDFSDRTTSALEFLPEGNLMLVYYAGSGKMHLVDTEKKLICKTWDKALEGLHSDPTNRRQTRRLEVSGDGRAVALFSSDYLWVRPPQK